MLGVVFYPLHARTQSLVHGPNLAPLVSTLLVLLVATIPLLLLGSALRGELRAVAQSLRETGPEGGLSPYLAHWRDALLERVENYVNLAQFDAHAALLRWAEQASQYLFSIGTTVISNLLSFALNTVVVFFTLFFYFREGKGIRRALSELLPFDMEHRDRFFKGISETIVGNLYGSLAVGVAQGALTGLAFWVLGLSAPVLWALATVVASLVPIVGSGLVWAPASLFLIMTGHWMKALLLLVWGAAVVGQVDVFVRPWVVGVHVKVHTLLLFFALLGGAKAFGPIGIFVGPIVLSFALAVVQMLRTTDFSLWSLAEKPQLTSVNHKSEENAT
jgi:predicted PurR-regulated permease PerM